MNDVCNASWPLKTGLNESIVAAAASRVGKTVLHIDANDYYGGQWASFNLESIQSFVSKTPSTECIIDNVEYRWRTESIKTTSSKNVIVASETSSVDGKEVSSGSTDEDPVEDVEWTKAKVLKEFRKFNIDIIPKVLNRINSVRNAQNSSQNFNFSCCSHVANWLSC